MKQDSVEFIEVLSSWRKRTYYWLIDHYKPKVVKGGYRSLKTAYELQRLCLSCMVRIWQWAFLSTRETMAVTERWTLFMLVVVASIRSLQRQPEHSVDYYELLKFGPETLTKKGWEIVVRTVLYQGDAGDDPDEAFHALENILFEHSQEWAGRRSRILQGAEKVSTNPSRRSQYCLTSLKNLSLDAMRAARQERESPELSLIYRQVGDHLRKLSREGIVDSHRLKTKWGRDVCTVWGLCSWGADWKKRVPAKVLEHIKRDLPIIFSYRDGKGIFEYSVILPEYIPVILEEYGASLSTAEIASTIVSKLSPPLSENPYYSDQEKLGDVSLAFGGDPGLTFFFPTPEELLSREQDRYQFMSSLSERELRVMQLKEDGYSIEQIAEELECSKRTVNASWKSVFEKYCLATAI